MHFRVFILLFLLGQNSYADLKCPPDSDNCQLAIFPHTNMRQIQSTYSPIAEEISFYIDMPVRVISSSNMQTFHENLSIKKYDIALSGPLRYVQFASKAGYIPIARRNSSFQFIITTLGKNKITSIKDLKNKKIGLLTNDIKEHALAYSLLKTEFKNPDKEITNKQMINQHACFHALKTKTVDACGMTTTVLEVLQNRDDDMLKILASSPTIPNAVFVAHPDLHPTTLQGLKDYFSDRPNYLLANDEDYDVVREIIQ